MKDLVCQFGDDVPGGCWLVQFETEVMAGKLHSFSCFGGSCSDGIRLWPSKSPSVQPHVFGRNATRALNSNGKVCKAQHATHLGYLSRWFLLAPIMATALAIELSSVGPVFLREPRTGFDGRTVSYSNLGLGPIRQDEVQDLSNLASVVSMNGVGPPFKTIPHRRTAATLRSLTGDMSLVGPDSAGDELWRVRYRATRIKSGRALQAGVR